MCFRLGPVWGCDIEKQLKLDETMYKIIKEQVKAQVKEQVSKILLRIEKSVTKQLEAEVLIHKVENNKSIDISVQQKTLYKALVDAYEADKMTMKNPSLDQTGGPREEELEKNLSHLKPPKPSTPDRDWNKTLPAAHEAIQPWISNLARKEDTRNSFNELTDTPLDFSAFVMNQLKVDTLTPELLADPTFELMKGSYKSQQYPHDLRKPLPLIPNSQGRRVIPFDHFINNDLTYLRGGVSSQTYATLVTKTKAADHGHIKWIEDLVPNIMWSPVPIVEWHNYNHLDWITVRKNDDKLYTFKEGDYKRLRLQDIEDMLLLLVQGKLTNLTIEERLPLILSLGFIYQNKDKKNKLMRIDELHKFSDGTLNDVRTDLDDILKRIRIKHLPQTYWRNVDKERARAMIQAIDKQLKNRRIMRSLENFVGGRPYEGDFWLLERTI
ncbi:hypothetical protein Tco_1408514 [Tanacetum coccineum]